MNEDFAKDFPRIASMGIMYVKEKATKEEILGLFLSGEVQGVARKYVDGSISKYCKGIYLGHFAASLKKALAESINDKEFSEKFIDVVYPSLGCFSVANVGINRFSIFLTEIFEASLNIGDKAKVFVSLRELLKSEENFSIRNLNRDKQEMLADVFEDILVSDLSGREVERLMRHFNPRELPHMAERLYKKEFIVPIIEIAPSITYESMKGRMTMEDVFGDTSDEGKHAVWQEQLESLKGLFDSANAKVKSKPSQRMKR